MNLFSIYAPAYWNAGLSVIPLRPQEKRPIPDDWSSFSDKLPPETMREAWLSAYPTSNIGLVLGPQSNMMVVDVDTEDARAQEVIRKLLPFTPWERRGRKGFVLGYKYNGLRTFRIKTREKGSLVEVLSNKTQVVIPPSIHPDTRMPYMATCNLLEVHQGLPLLPDDIESRLREALEAYGFALSTQGYSKITEFVSAGARDNAMISHAGILARAVTRGERTLMECFGEMQTWCDTYVEKVAGDEIDAQKGEAAIVQFLTRDVMGKRRVSLPKNWDVGLDEETKVAWGLNFGPEQEQWSFHQMRDHAQAVFERTQVSDPERMNCVNYVLERLARSQGSVSNLEEAALLQWLAQSARVNLSLPALRKELRVLRQGEMQGNDHTEIAQAVISDLEATGDLRFHNNRFWQWKGSDWQTVLDADLLRRIAEDYGNFPSATRHSDHQGILRVMATLVAGSLKTVDEPGINFANGYLDADLTIRPHDKIYGCTYTLPYAYRPEIADTCFRFHQFLHDCWGQDEDYQEKLAALQEAMAATLFGLGPQFNRAIVLFGNARTGKSELLNILIGLLPDESYSVVPPTDWADPFKPAMMRDVLLNYCGELHEKKMIDGSLFKAIIEGGEINGQEKNKPIFKFRPHCTHWFAGNYPPKSQDVTEGFNRRWLILQFSHPVDPKNVVVSIGNRILAEEREAIAAWAVAGVTRLRRNHGYTLPESHQQLIGEVANNNNSVRYYLTTSRRVVMGVEAVIGEEQLHEDYRRYFLINGHAKPVGLREFRTRMRELCPQFGLTMEVSNDDQATYSGLAIQKAAR